jgi:hypothetical protein
MQLPLNTLLFCGGSREGEKGESITEIEYSKIGKRKIVHKIEQFMNILTTILSNLHRLSVGKNFFDSFLFLNRITLKLVGDIREGCRFG